MAGWVTGMGLLVLLGGLGVAVIGVVFGLRLLRGAEEPGEAVGPETRNPQAEIDSRPRTPEL